MLRPCRPSLLVLALLLAPACMDPAARLQQFRTGSLKSNATTEIKRGINLSDAMEAPNEGDWGITLESSDFKVVKAAGFDHVRVPMRFNAHADPSPPYRLHSAFMRRVDWVIDQALSNDLAVIVDFHHFVELMKNPDGQAARLVGIWRNIAERYKGLPSSVIYEILNEPTDQMTAAKWNPILAACIRTIRQIDPTRTLIVEGAYWASAQNLRDTLQVPAGDPNIIGSFHMYHPMLFTHQGFGWMPPEYGTHRVVFPGPPPKPITPCGAASAVDWSRIWFARYNTEPEATNPGGPSAVTEQLDMAKAFMKRTGLRVYMGEWGAPLSADTESRARWARLVRTEAEKRGFSWAWWDFAHNFAAYTKTPFGGVWISEVKSALLDN